MTIPAFNDSLSKNSLILDRKAPEILQINVGKLCNLTCSHCHVNAGPGRKEIISKQTIDRILLWLQSHPVPKIDLTGGAPEMIPDFQYFIQNLRNILPNAEIIDRCNLTILLDERFDWLANFLKSHHIQIVASMPCYSPENVNEQRGDGVFDSSIKALQLLNSIGYGDGNLPLHLVYNPNGAFLPGPQSELEKDYKHELHKHFNIVFDKLFCISNVPISRFAAYLKRNNQYSEYLTLLRNAFNPETVDGLMCRNTVNVSWEGDVFDCDFNQMLKMPTKIPNRKTVKIWDLEFEDWMESNIATGPHCYACTAGTGSSCSGSIA